MELFKEATKHNPDFPKTKPGRILKTIEHGGRDTFLTTFVIVNVQQLAALKEWVATASIETAHAFQGIGAFAYGIAGILNTIKLAKTKIELCRSCLQYGAAMLGLTANACRDHVPSTEAITYIEVVAIGIYGVCALEELLQNIVEAVRNRDIDTRGDGYESLPSSRHSGGDEF